MKTKLLIEFETKNMKKVVPEEYIGDDERCPEDEEMTDEIEAGLHNKFISIIREMLENKGYLWDGFEEELIGDEESVEGFESLEDYGDIKIKVNEVQDGTK